MAQMEKFLSVPQAVRARRLFVDGYDEINRRRALIPAGMWVVTAVGGNGVQILMPDDVFRIQFRPTDAASEAMWKEQTKTVYPQWPDGEPIPLS